jgi:DNA-binding transcriptional LysR family regulator
VPAPPRHTLDQLVVFEAIAEAGSFSAAARALHRVPSAVSYAVAGLEDALGVVLFDRAHQKAVLTPAGRRLLASARALLESARRLDALGLSLSGGVEPTVHVIADGALPMGPVIEALGRFTALGLPTRVRFDVEFQQGTIDAFLARRADLVLALDLDGAGPVRDVPLPPLDMVLVAAAGHPLVAAGPVDRAALHAHIELVVRDSALRFREAPREPWFGTAHAVHLGDFPAKRLALLAGLGFGWMPLHLVADDLAARALAVVPLVEGDRWTYRPSLAHRADAPPGPAAARLHALIVEAFAAFVAPDPAPARAPGGHQKI